MLKTVTCADCRVDFRYEYRTGATRQRCDLCTASRKSAIAAEKMRRWREANPELYRAASRRGHEKRKDDPSWRQYKRDAELRRKYGVTAEVLQNLLREQENACAICKRPQQDGGKRLHVDHCHDTGRVRGLLCSNCNTFIGLAEDDPERLRQAIAYLGGPT